MLPKKRKRERSGIERGPRRNWPKHERWVRSHSCSVPGCEDHPIEFMHLRSAANSGTGLKPHSAHGISGCWRHHQEAHRIGHETFARKYGIDLWALAAEFAQKSPDIEMRMSLRENPP